MGSDAVGTPGTRRETSRERLIEAGAELFGRQGYHGTGIKQVIDAARAPFASLYHFFPGGKEELGAAAIRRAGAAYATHVGERWAPADDIVAATEAAFAGAAQTMRESDFGDACPIATIALEISSSSEPMRIACDDVFRSWIAGMAAVFAHGGVPPERAEPLATQWLALLEGAFIFCRAARTTDALDAAGRAAAALVRAALD